MSFNDLANTRYSCRDFQRFKTVSRELLTKVIDSARLAPSACNRQPWTFIVIDDLCEPSSRQAVIECYNRPWMNNANAFIIACGNHDEAWHRPTDGKDHTDVDLSIAIEHICLAAADEGLGTCWVCNFDVATLSDKLNIPTNIEPIAIIPIGYPSEGSTATPKNRKEIDQIIKWGSF